VVCFATLTLSRIGTEKWHYRKLILIYDFMYSTLQRKIDCIKISTISAVWSMHPSIFDRKMRDGDGGQYTLWSS
jgi:hypothetical protein